MKSWPTFMKEELPQTPVINLLSSHCYLLNSKKSLKKNYNDNFKFWILPITFWFLTGVYAYLLSSIIDFIGIGYIFHWYLIFFAETIVNEMNFFSHQTKIKFLKSHFCLVAFMGNGGRSRRNTTDIYRELETIWGELLVGTRTYLGVGARKYVANTQPFIPTLVVSETTVSDLILVTIGGPSHCWLEDEKDNRQTSDIFQPWIGRNNSTMREWQKNRNVSRGLHWTKRKWETN